MLHERPARSPRSRLYFLETECYRFLDRPDEALAVARAGVDSASRAGAIDMATEQLTSRDTRKLSNAVASAQANSKVLSDFRNYFRAGVSSALKGRIFDEGINL